jgi:hypothetical protein
MSGANLLAKLARKLPRLKDAYRDFVNYTQGQIERAFGDLWVRLNTCEDALGPEPAPAVKETFDALRRSVEAVQRASPRQERLELAQLIDGLLSLLEAPEMADVLRRSAETTAAVEPPAAADTPSFSVTIDTAGLTDAEAVMLATGYQLGVQLALSHGSAASVSTAEIRRAFETWREAQREAQQPRGLLH